MKEDVIIQKVINNLKAIAGVDAVLETTTQERVDYGIKIRWEQEWFPFTVEVKKEIRRFQMPELLGYKNQYQYFLLVAQKLYPNIRQELQEEGVNYIEANGNMFIQRPGLYMLVEGKPPLPEEKKESNRAFTKTGLQAVFVMLAKPQLLNATQRKLAEEAGVALGNIPHVMEGLLKAGYIVKHGQGLYQWRNYNKLIDKWADEYVTTLKPTLKQGTYTFTNNEDWWQTEFKTTQTCWGGEPAGDLYTKYLRPELYTVYTTENRLDLIQHYGWKPKEKGEILVYEKFWTAPAQHQRVPALLAYADLMESGDKRCTETAKMIYDKHLKDI
jgi:hypothetical protein